MGPLKIDLKILILHLRIHYVNFRQRSILAARPKYDGYYWMTNYKQLYKLYKGDIELRIQY